MSCHYRLHFYSNDKIRCLLAASGCLPPLRPVPGWDYFWYPFQTFSRSARWIVSMT
jgi:hypothetical protein